MLLSADTYTRGPGLPLSTYKQQAPVLARELLSWLGIVQLSIGVLAASTAFGLYVYQSLSGGPQQILLLSLVRFTFLLLVGVLTCKAFGFQAPEGYTRLHKSRPGLARAALFAQLLWFSSELLLGSALLTFYPLLRGTHTDLAVVTQASRVLYRIITVVYLAGMTGCLCFLSSLARRRRRSERHTDCSSLASGCSVAGSTVVLVGKDSSPVSDAGSFSSGASSELYYPASNAGSPTGPLPPPQSSHGRHAHPGTHSSVCCEVTLVEHEVSGSPDGRGLFVHKSLRPIRTRPEERPYIPLLKPIISNSFSFQEDQAAAMRAGLTVQQSGGSFGFVTGRSGSSSGMQRVQL